jgi:hypothetical protein
MIGFGTGADMAAWVVDGPDDPIGQGLDGVVAAVAEPFDPALRRG